MRIAGFHWAVPLAALAIALPAAAQKATLTVYTALGSLVWNAVLIGAGYELGENWEQVAEWVGNLQHAVIAAILGFAGWWVWTRLVSPAARSRRAVERAELAAQQEAAIEVLEHTAHDEHDADLDRA